MEALAIDVIVRGTALLALVFGLVATLRGASAATRHLAWSFGMVGLLALPILSAVLPWRLEIVPAGFAPLLVVPGDEARMEGALPSDLAVRQTGSTSAVSSAIDPPPLDEPIGGHAPASSSLESPSADGPSTGQPFATAGAAAEVAGESSYSPSSPGSSVATAGLLLPALLVVWLAGALLVFGRLLTGQLALWWLACRASPLDDPAWMETAREVASRLGVESAGVRLLESDRVAIPLTSGLIRPVILLPAAAEAWSVERRRAVLLHELAHVSRRDLLPHWLAWAACALYWFHPLVWIAARRLRSESERACDDLVLRLGPRASEYARHLIQIVRAAGPYPTPAAVLPLARRSDLEGRVKAILRPGLRRHGLTLRGAAPVAFAVLVFTVPVAAISPAGEVPVPPPSTWSADEKPTKHGGPDDRSPVRIAGEAVPAEGIESMSTEDGKGVKLEIGEVEVEFGEVVTVELPELPAGQEGHPGKDVTGRAVTQIGAATRDGSREVRLAAVTALGELDDPRAVAALSKALREDPDPEVRKMAAWALGELEDPRGVPALVEALLTDQSDEVRSTAAWALGEIEDEAAVAGLGEALRDQNVEIRRKAAWALGEIESPEAVAALSAAIEDGDAEVRRTAVWALGEIEDPAAVPALVRVLQDSDVEIRQMAAWALAEIESPAAVEALSVALQDSDVEVRRSAARALGEIEDGAAVPALKGALNDPDADVRRAAAFALAEIESPAAIEALVPLLESDDPEIRKMAIEAIAENQ